MDKYIGNQKEFNISTIRWGKFSTIGRSGCGAVAAYNVAVALGKNPDFVRMVRGMEKKHLPSFGGLLGMNVFRLKFWLQRRFGRADLYLFGSEDWEEKTRFCRAVVIFYKNKGIFNGNHFIAGTRKGDKFFFHNSSVFAADKGMGMEKVVAKLKKSGNTPVMLIVV